MKKRRRKDDMKEIQGHKNQDNITALDLICLSSQVLELGVTQRIIPRGLERRGDRECVCVCVFGGG